ncbi:amidohydrolase [Streptomonospora litoralis]|uniref:N-substituted formamide deformylase n=1 Tax=Streptomonospora litoralis TaxID=2498135 RepID=A0A4P6QBA9_9ACTN|nr:amidohydrolase [Streptomonospora litoralis]QBI56687.1 N-substituted formamide deformylase precursor [Streptomonospora litoralis]
MEYADTVFYNGPVLTMDAAAPRAAALAATGGLISAVGAREEIERLRGPGTETVDLAGRALLPGFVEAHGHPLNTAFTLAPPALDVRPFGLPDGASVYRAIRRRLAEKPDEPLLAYGIDLLLQRDLEVPTRALLDELSPRAPLVVMTNSGHAAYANTPALRAAGVTRESADPEGARFVRDAAGEPTGEAHETAAVTELSRVALAGVTPQSALAALRWTLRRHAAAGVTTVADLACAPAFLPLLEAAAHEPDVPVRTRAYLIGDEALAADPGRRFAGHAPAAELCGVAGVKLWADGSPWQGSVATSFPFKDNAATRRIGLAGCPHGQMNYRPEQLADLAAAFTAKGFPLACHVHGDVTADAVLAACAEAAAQDPETVRRLRPRLEHCGALTAEQFRRAAGLGATVSLFVDHIRYWGGVLDHDLFGRGRAEAWMAARSALDAGHRISLHNDGCCSPLDPLSSVSTAVTRNCDTNGEVYGADQRLTVEEALRAVTADAAWQLHLEDEVGTLRPGMRADLTVLTADPEAVPAAELRRGVRVCATYLGGRRTFAT